MNDKHFMPGRAGVAGALLVVAALAGCSSGGSDEASEPSRPTSTRSYVGTAQGTQAFVAVVVDGSRALTYVCDGVPGEPVGTTPSLQAWFNGPFEGGAVAVDTPDGRLELQLTDTEMTGALVLADGRNLSVTGRAVSGDAGLYRAEAAGDGGRAVAGWILAADGQQRGGVGGEGTSLARISGTRVLDLAQPTFSFQNLATARIAKVGITPIPIP